MTHDPPPPGWLPDGTAQEWEKLLKYAQNPETAAASLTRRMQILHDCIQLPDGLTLGDHKPEPFTPNVVEAFQWAANLYKVELPPEFHVMASRILRSHYQWRPMSTDHPFGSAILFPAYLPNNEPLPGLKALLRYQTYNGTVVEQRLPIRFETPKGPEALIPEGVPCDLEWRWERHVGEGISFPRAQIYSYDRHGFERLSAQRIANGNSWSRVLLEDPPPHFPVPEIPPP